MFFDMEGLPEVNFNYLIGLIIVSDGQTKSYSLWIDTMENEKSMIKDFIGVINNYNPCTIYHYGDYEIKYLKYIKKKFPETEVEIDKIIA